MKKEIKREIVPEEWEIPQPTSIRVRKGQRLKNYTSLKKNDNIVGDSIEIMMVKINEGEGEGSIEDRDLVYNDNEATEANPLTNIRSDKFELMLEEKIGEYEHKDRKLQRTKDAEEEKIKEKEKEAGAEENPTG